jgi:hypothetical protein
LLGLAAATFKNKVSYECDFFMQSEKAAALTFTLHLPKNTTASGRPTASTPSEKWTTTKRGSTKVIGKMVVVKARVCLPTPTAIFTLDGVDTARKT